MLPTTTVPKATVDGLAVTAPSATPEPLSGMSSMGFEPSEVTVMLPVALPVPVGANFTVKLTVWPALSVTGKVRPLILKPVPDAAAAVIWTFDPPELVNVSEIVWFVPT